MKGLIKEGQEVIDEDLPDTVKDAALIGAAQKVEHYEIASYGTLRTHAELLDREDVARLLQATLDEESAGLSRSFASALRTNTIRCGCEFAVVGPHLARS